MARFNASEIENYGNGGGGTSFFSLKNDKDTARVRFMYNGIDDIAGYAVHEVEVDGKRRYVNCLREYDDPKHKCPLCASGNFQRAKLYVPLYDVDTGEVKVWERGKKFYGKLAGICSRYPNTCSHTFEIQRFGKKGDTATTYEIFETGQDNTTLDQLGEIPEVLGTIILDKDAEELATYLSTGSMPQNNAVRNTQADVPIRRQPTYNAQPQYAQQPVAPQQPVAQPQYAQQPVAPQPQYAQQPVNQQYAQQPVAQPQQPQRRTPANVGTQNNEVF